MFVSTPTYPASKCLIKLVDFVSFFLFCLDKSLSAQSTWVSLDYLRLVAVCVCFCSIPTFSFSFCSLLYLHVPSILIYCTLLSFVKFYKMGSKSKFNIVTSAFIFKICTLLVHKCAEITTYMYLTPVLI